MIRNSRLLEYFIILDRGQHERENSPTFPNVPPELLTLLGARHTPRGRWRMQQSDHRPATEVCRYRLRGFQQDIQTMPLAASRPCRCRHPFACIRWKTHRNTSPNHSLHGATKVVILATVNVSGRIRRQLTTCFVFLSTQRCRGRGAAQSFVVSFG